MSSISDLTDRSTHHAAGAPSPAWRRGAGRAVAAATALAMALSLGGCGGGGDVLVGPFSIGVLIGGSPYGTPIAPGTMQRLSIYAGQSLELDANEPVVWTLEVNGSSVTTSGATVYYAGVYVTLTAISSSRIVVDTSAPYALTSPVPIRLVATSTIDAAQVATFDVLIY